MKKVMDLLENVYADMEALQENVDELHEELLRNYEYGVSNNRNFEELLFVEELLTLMSSHYTKFADRTTKILHL